MGPIERLRDVIRRRNDRANGFAVALGVDAVDDEGAPRRSEHVCPECGGDAVIDVVDLRQAATELRCRACGHRWTVATAASPR